MKNLYLLLATGLFLSSSVFAGRIEKATEKVDAKEAKYIDIEGELGAGEFRITTGDIDQLAIFEIEYNERSVKYDVDYYERGDKGFLTFESHHRNHGDFDDSKNKWDIVLSTKYESMLNLNIGAADAQMDLGGLPLKELKINVGAASGIIEFSKPNPIRMQEISVEAGASSLDMKMIGNANFERFDFSGGVGAFELDFLGKYEGESEINIEVGLGSAEIYLPSDVPIRIVTDGGNWFSSIDFHNDDLEEIEDDEYESSGFANAKTRIVLRIEVGMGSVDIYWKN